MTAGDYDLRHLKPVSVGFDTGSRDGDLATFGAFDGFTRTLHLHSCAVPTAFLRPRGIGSAYAEDLRAERALAKLLANFDALFASWQREPAPAGRISKRRARRLRGRAKAQRRAGAW